MAVITYPALYQINTRIWLRELAQQLGRPATLADIPDGALDQIRDLGFDWVWLLGVWQTGPAGRKVSLAQPAWWPEYSAILPDFREEDVTGSPFAVQVYTGHRDFGGNDALRAIRQRLRQRGLRLMLDFVPNHVALDHPWVQEHPEFFIAGTDAHLAREPQNYIRLDTSRGSRVLAYGRDPYFPGWPDTLQLNYANPALRQAMLQELLTVAAFCDGVRCDMAMLILPEVFARTWGPAAQPLNGLPPYRTSFWPEAIGQVRTQHPGFIFLAEVYWDLEWALQQQGFDYTYDKRLYDRLHARDAAAVRGHLHAELDFQKRSARFLENHDEPRAASAFPAKIHMAAAIVTFFVPGMRFIYEGQLEGRKTRVSNHLGRRPAEPIDAALQKFYHGLLEALKRPEVRSGRWQLMNCRPAWEGNPTWNNFLAFLWEGAAGKHLLVLVNYGPTQAQCYVRLPLSDLRGRRFLFRDLLSSAKYERQGNDLANWGLYLDMPEWAYHVFEFSPAG